MRKVNDPQKRSADQRITSISGNVTVKMTMRYSTVLVTIPNVIIPRTAAARDVTNAWWAAVEANHIQGPGGI
jgi:hypothetical protein